MTDDSKFLEHHHEYHERGGWHSTALVALGVVLFIAALLVAWRLGPL